MADDDVRPVLAWAKCQALTPERRDDGIPLIAIAAPEGAPLQASADATPRSVGSGATSEMTPTCASRLSPARENGSGRSKAATR